MEKKPDRSDPQKPQNGSGSVEGDLDAKLLNEVDEGLGRLQDRLSDLRQQLLSPFEKVEKLAQEQKQFETRLEGNLRKGKLLAVLALGAAVPALLLALLFTGTTLHLKSGLSRVEGRMGDLEKDLTALKTEPPSADIAAFREALDANARSIETLNAWMTETRRRPEPANPPAPESEAAVKKERVETLNRVDAAAQKPEQVPDPPDPLEEGDAPLSKKKPSSAWSVNLVSFVKVGYARRVADQYAAGGVPIRIKAVTVDGKTWYRLYVTGFQNQKAAEAYAGQVEKDLQLSSVWISRN